MLTKKPSKEEINSVISLFSSGLFHETIEMLDTLNKDYPNQPLLLNITGACFAGLGQFNTAIKYYKNAIEIEPDYAKAHFNLAGVLHDQGELEESVNSYKNSLNYDSTYAEAHNNLANIYRELGELEKSINSYKNALSLNPNYAEAHFSLASTYEDYGKLNLAIEHLKRALKLNPNFAEAHNSLGMMFRKIGQLGDSIKSYLNAININSNFFEAHNNLGSSYLGLGQLDNAVNSYKRALSIDPTYPALHNNLGNAYKKLGQLDAAVKSCKDAITINPDYQDAHNNLGVIFYDLGQFDSSVKSYRRALEINPNYAEAHNNLGVSLNKLGQLEEAVQSYEASLNINPEYFDSYNNLGVVLKKLGQVDAAVNAYQHAIEINPEDADTYNNLGIALSDLERLDDAIEAYDKAVAKKPNFAEAYNNLGIVFSKLNNYDYAINAYEKAFAAKPDLDYVLGNILSGKMNTCNWHNLPNLLVETRKKINKNLKIIDPFTLFGLIDDPTLAKKAIELRMISDHPKSYVLTKMDDYSKHPKVRIGYFSGDFRNHPVSYLTAELYEVHDRNNFEIHAFSLGPDTKDEMNLRIKAGVDYFHDVFSMSHKEIALLSRSLEIDIAVDLAGLTAESRTDVFAMSAAPIQVSYIGFLGTMGANYYDYLIADPVMIPEENQKDYSEKIVYLPSFQVNDSSEVPPDIVFTRGDLGLPEKGFIFCCFNNTYKFTPSVFDSWGRILKSVEGSSLIVFANNELSKTNLSREISQRGVDKNRLIFGDSLPRPEYLARFRVVDLFLDTHPYNAGTTASDALRMGCPMITCIGKSYQARMGASILNAIELPELVTKTFEDYEKVAIDLAKNPLKYKIIKDKLINNISSAPLFNTSLFTKNLESAYTKMYKNYHKKLKPDHIYVVN